MTHKITYPNTVHSIFSLILRFFGLSNLAKLMPVTLQNKHLIQIWLEHYFHFRSSIMHKIVLF